MLLTFYLAAFYKLKLSKSIYLIACLVLFFSAMVFVRASRFLTLLNIGMVFYLLLLITQLASWPYHKLKSYTFNHYAIQLLYLPAWIVREFLAFLETLIKGHSEGNSQKHSVAPIIRGIMLSLPFLIIFLLLFSSADLVFKHYVSSLFDFKLSPTLIVQTLLVLFIASLFIGTYALIFLDSNKPDKQASVPRKQMILGSVESSIILGSVTLLFLLFVIIQITYLFGGSSNIAGGFTYSQYARKGFFELIVVALISLALLLMLHKSVARNNRRQSLEFMALSGLLIVEVMLIMISAFKRLALYEQAYGFTELRLYSHLFIGWLAVVFVLLFLYIVRQQKDNQFAFGIFISVIIFLALINFISPDTLIARQNVQRLHATGKMDAAYLTNLSDDATPVITKLLSDPNPKVRNIIASALYYQKQAIESRTQPWQSFNLARHRGRQLLEQNATQLEQNKGYTLPSSGPPSSIPVEIQ